MNEGAAGRGPFGAASRFSPPTPLLSDAELSARLLHRDGLMLILDKPAGLPVHRGPNGGPTLEDGLDALRFGLPAAPVLAHRLDRDTSGCLVLGRHRKATARLGRLFAGNRVSKTYLPVLTGRLPAGEGTVDLPLARASPDPRSWRMAVAPIGDPAGQPALTRWRVLGEGPGGTLVELCPTTGRTHQLRVHAAALGCPILGDPVYGTALSDIRLQLHAWRILVPMQDARPPVAATAPIPADMRAQVGDGLA